MSSHRLLACLLALHVIACGHAFVLANPPIEESLPMLPDAVDSFGAAEHDGFLYVYGGHQGSEQEQTGKNVSRQFVRCDLDQPSQWEQLPLDKPLQSLALVSCGDSLYRVGGAGLVNADNPTAPVGSVSDFMRFDPRTKEWTALTPLPAPRSAHDAIAADGKIYVVGGWDHSDAKPSDWHDSALMFDTTAGEEATWQSLPIPSFRRRNLAVAAWQNCIWAIGGKDDNDVIYRTVFYYDPQRGYWSEGPELPARADGLQGYGVAAWGLDSGLYVSGADGALYRLDTMYGEWQQVGELRVQRYCHRLLPDGDRALLALAGSSVSYGPTRSVERLKVYSP
ncbi:MAG: hypothetical protein SH868_05285 [Bythopirellula sp.]|nr:hypothetical protein [Bythopirellula sp.]